MSHETELKCTDCGHAWNEVLESWPAYGDCPGCKRHLTFFCRREPASIISDDMPKDGRNWDCRCARCGSSVESESCGACGGEGVTGHGELHEQDPLWYDADDYEPCHQCSGEGSWMFCLSNIEWCEANPIKGRENVPRGKIEWFTFEQVKI